MVYLVQATAIPTSHGSMKTCSGIWVRNVHKSHICNLLCAGAAVARHCNDLALCLVNEIIGWKQYWVLAMRLGSMPDCTIIELFACNKLRFKNHTVRDQRIEANQTCKQQACVPTCVLNTVIRNPNKSRLLSKKRLGKLSWSENPVNHLHLQPIK